MALQPRPAQTNRLADLVNGEDRPKPVPIGTATAGTAGQNFAGKNSQAHCPVCELITSLQILREIFSADDSQCCPLHLLEVRGYVTRSGYGKKAISREEVTDRTSRLAQKLP